ncbi:hypothetical protein IBX73_10920, partial [candidate division WOR-3 bacterium]|nr:hypothetical protein [candidate division WOR-3 bacterium]
MGGKIINAVSSEKSTVKIMKGESGRIRVSFSYEPVLVEKIKTIAGRRWHPEGKYWSLPDTKRTLEKIIKIFEGKKIHIDPVLKKRLTLPVIARSEAKLALSESNGKQSQNKFEDLRRE